MLRKHKDEEIRNCLDVLQEECAEVIQAISKIKRFGFKSRNPYVANSKENIEILFNEYGDLKGAMDLLGNLLFDTFEESCDYYGISEDQRRIKPSNINKHYKITKEL